MVMSTGMNENEDVLTWRWIVPMMEDGGIYV